MKQCKICLQQKEDILFPEIKRTHTYRRVCKQCTNIQSKERRLKRKGALYTKPIPIEFDHAYFKVLNTSNKSYWLGFILADGNIYQNQFKLKLSITDEDHLKNLKTELKSNHNIYYENNKKACFIRICSNSFCNNLISLGCLPNKSLIVKYPNTNNFDSHFIRGYFDGDGCFYNYKNKQATFSIVSGSLDILESIKNILTNKLNIKINMYCRKTKNITHVLSVSRIEDLKKLYHFLYDEAEYFLNRKRIKFFNFIQNH